MRTLKFLVEFLSEYTKSKTTLKIFFIGFVIYIILLNLLVKFEREASSSIDTIYEAFYYSIVTFTTVGYGDLVPISTGGRVIAIIFIFGTIGFFGFVIGLISNLMKELNESTRNGWLGCDFEKHAIIVGWNQSAAAVAKQLSGVNKKITVITNSNQDLQTIIDNYKSPNFYVLFCEYDNYEMIKKSNIEKSTTVLMNLNSDADNLINIINYKKVYPHLNYVVQIENTDLKNTFLTAGVSHVVCKNEIGSNLLASYIFEPDVATYSEDIMTYAETAEDQDIKEFEIIKDNPFAGKSYNESFYRFKQDFNSVLIGITKLENGRRQLYKNPRVDLTIEEGDYLIFICGLEESTKLQSLFKVSEGTLK